ncbi:MAG: hypothetical protein WAM94_19735 [Chromatiaceae bacterium]
MIRIHALTLAAILAGIGLTACTTREMVSGAAVGGAAYEYSNKRAMDAARTDYEKGIITGQEYQRRKDQIEERSLIY